MTSPNGSRQRMGFSRASAEPSRRMRWSGPISSGGSSSDPPVDLDVLPPRARTFVELLRAAGIRETRPVYGHVRRVMAAARAQRGVERAS
jgi:hypothetical protein